MGYEVFSYDGKTARYDRGIPLINAALNLKRLVKAV